MQYNRTSVLARRLENLQQKMEDTRTAVLDKLLLPDSAGVSEGTTSRFNQSQIGAPS